MPTPSLVNIPFITAPNVLFSQIPESGAGDFVVSRTTSPDSGQSTRVNAAGFIELVADNVARLDYPLGGAANGCPALLVEPAATNSIRNNSMVGASAPNTLPTNWSNAGSGLTRQSVVTGTLNGIPYVDIRISGTANNAFHDVFWDASNIIAASVGQNWAASCYLQIIAQPNPPVSYNLAMREFNSGGGFLSVFTGPSLSISTTSFNRFSFTRALNQATVAFVHPSLFLGLVNGQTYDFTIRIGYPQMEIGSVATSVIHTTTAAITRGADVIRKTSITSLIGQSEGAVYFEVEVTDEARNKWFCTLDSASGSFIQMWVNPTRQINVQIQNNSSVVMTQLTSSALTVGYHKIAFAYNTATNGCIMYIDGVQNPAATTRTVVAPGLPAFNNMSFGTYLSTTVDTLKAHVRAGLVYPNRISDLDLEFLTAPVTYTTYAQMANALSYILP
jgi:hypothetical protein